MNREIPIIKLWTTESDYYVYDVYKNKILSVNKNVYLELTKLKKIGISNYLKLQDGSTSYRDTIHLIKKGFFSPSQILDISHPWTNYANILAERHTNNVTLQVTQNCNFKCRYCSFACDNFDRNHNDKNMTWDIAKKSLDFVYNHSKDAEFIDLGFYGGEPILNFAIIKESVDYIKKLIENKPIVFSLTTNAIALKQEHLDFFIKHDFNILISLDGPSEIHNKFRRFKETGKPTFSAVENAVKMINEQAPRYFQNRVKFNPVIVNYSDLPIVLDYFYNELGVKPNSVSPSIVNLKGTDYIINDINDISAPLAYQAILENKRKQEGENQKDLIEEVLSKCNQITSCYHHNGPCIPGFNRLMIDVNGDFHVCEKIQENCQLKIGSVFTGYNFKALKGYMEIGKISEEECKKCWAIRFCKMCICECLDHNGKLSNAEKVKSCEEQKQRVLSHLKEYVRKN